VAEVRSALSGINEWFDDYIAAEESDPGKVWGTLLLLLFFFYFFLFIFFTMIFMLLNNYINNYYKKYILFDFIKIKLQKILIKYKIKNKI